MDGLDTLLLKAITKSIQDEMDSEKIDSIDVRLRQEYGLTFQEVFSKFDNMRNALQKFEVEFKDIEDKVLRNFLTIDKSTASDTWLIVKDRHLAEMILKTFADSDKKLILDCIRDKPETIPKTLSLCNLPNTSGYRKMNQLIEDGFVLPIGLTESFEGKRAILYKAIIQKIQIAINKDIVVTSISIPKESLRTSQVINTMLHINHNTKNVLN
ncbi:MAG: hypothetical protein EB150_07200 [Nitrososphaeria archaeon]|nr:hypothetical protein [Nitrososphaeria archaeon]NDB51162.1 hypothetical protein [Nitrosopumilaceae archaeon]NDB87649.1 hypothetical protein [Nitrososphaerota archaeon]NDB46042.1 hypothetical protein [Nitrososphaeria archaeon]NDB63371.1 hypothetical protein [Nitrosopumilaceae archaeon]